MNFNDNIHVNMTNITDPNIKMGLDDKICEDPIYFCLCHKVYLSDADVERKSCRHKMTPDMMGFVNCRWLMESDEYTAMIEKRNQIIRNNKLSNANRKASDLSDQLMNYKISLSKLAKPIMPSELQKVRIDYNGLINYAKQKGVCVSELSDSEKNRFVRREE